MDSSDERKKPLLEQKSSFRKLQQTPRSQPSSDQTATPSVLRTTRTPGSGISVTSPDKSLALDDVDNAEGSYYLLGAAGQISVTGGDSSEIAGDEVDYHSYPVGHPKTKAAIDQLQAKIQRTKVMIEKEQNAKSENVNEYLRLSAGADRLQAPRIKVVFEKKNQKSTQTIAQLQRKLDIYQKRLKDAEHHGITGHKQAKDVLKDVGQGLKDFFAREPIRSRDGSPCGVRDASLSGREGSSGTKAKVLENRFGSADNISSVKFVKDGGHGLTDEKLDRPSQQTLGTYQTSLKDTSDDEGSSAVSDSILSGEFSYPVGIQPEQMTASNLMDLQSSSGDNHQELSQAVTTKVASYTADDVAKILCELQSSQTEQNQLQSTVESLKNQLHTESRFYCQLLEEEKDHCERLEEQINDLSELHQHEITNIKQELSSMQEKMEYQLEERTRDMQELLESCQTKITKMELQQQQQQLISMEGIENSNFRALLTKLINVMLALLAVVLVLVSTLANLIGPFLTTRLRIISTVCLIAGLVVTWDNWPVISNMIHTLVDKTTRHFVST